MSTSRLPPQGEQPVNGYGVLDLYDYNVRACVHGAIPMICVTVHVGACKHTRLLRQRTNTHAV